MNSSLQFALAMFFKFVSTKRVLEVVGEYLKTKILPLAPVELMDFIADLANYVFAKAPAEVVAAHQAAQSEKAAGK
jgi:hypothetical protein